MTPKITSISLRQKTLNNTFIYCHCDIQIDNTLNLYGCALTRTATGLTRLLGPRGSDKSSRVSWPQDSEFGQDILDAAIHAYEALADASIEDAA